MRSLLLAIFAAVSLTSQSQNVTAYVNPFIGTANEGYTNPGAVLPGGMSLSPLNTYDTLQPNWQRPSPYIYGGKNIVGFSHLNLSGTGCPELGVFMLMPTTGTLQIKPASYWSGYSNEVATPGYYSVKLYKYNIKTELTTTLRTGVSRYTFPEGQGNIIINMGLSLSERKGAVVRRISDTEVEGSKSIGGMCGGNTAQTVYFVMRLSKKPVACGVWNDNRRFANYMRPMEGNDVGAYLTFKTEDGETVLVKTATSFVSTENAWANLEAEQPAFDFDATRTNAAKIWETELSKIMVEGGTADDKTMFYTALYHMLLHPNVFNDVNGEYPAVQSNEIASPNSNKIFKTNGSDYYTTFSLWDTYRNMHPFLSLVYPQKELALVKTMLAMYTETGWLPKLEYGGMETYMMVGDPSLSVIADTYQRGIRGFDINLAYEAMKHNATVAEADNPVRPGFDNLRKYGYIPEDAKNIRGIWGSVSSAQEYCMADWNLAQMAKAFGKIDDYNLFYNRSMLYKNYFDTSTNFIRPRLAIGSWYTPFSPSSGGGTSTSQAGFVEGNTWQYTFFEPYDIPGLIKLMGGEKNFVQKLSVCFDSGYFNMGNEPDMAYPYLFNYVKGQEWQTQKRVRAMIYSQFGNAPNGLPGNDDCGTTSACLLFAMMGFYPTCPGDMDFQLASPLFDKITIHLDSQFYPGKEFVIEARNAGKNNCYIQQMQLNGKPYKQYTINHKDIVNGGKLTFVLKAEHSN